MARLRLSRQRGATKRAADSPRGDTIGCWWQARISRSTARPSRRGSSALGSRPPPCGKICSSSQWEGRRRGARIRRHPRARVGSLTTRPRSALYARGDLLLFPLAADNPPARAHRVDRLRPRRCSGAARRRRARDRRARSLGWLVSSLEPATMLATLVPLLAQRRLAALRESARASPRRFRPSSPTRLHRALSRAHAPEVPPREAVGRHPFVNQGQFLAQSDRLGARLRAGEIPELIVMDGGSQTIPVEVLRTYAKHLPHWDSAPTGPVPTRSSRFARCTGDIMGGSAPTTTPPAPDGDRRLVSWHPEESWIYGTGAHVDVTGRQVEMVKVASPTSPNLPTLVLACSRGVLLAPRLWEKTGAASTNRCTTRWTGAHAPFAQHAKLISARAVRRARSPRLEDDARARRTQPPRPPQPRDDRISPALRGCSATTTSPIPGFA